MAKKEQQKLSYGPNLGLIGGARDVALSEAAKTSAGGTAFAKGLEQSLMVGIIEKKQREDKLDAWMDNLGGIENINLLDQGYNKEAVTEFLRNGRDEYAVLSEQFERTKDRAVKDKMDEIKFSFQNLNNQLQGLVKDRRDYADAVDKKQLVTLENGDEKFVDRYTNQSAFGISANGDIGYIGDDGSYTKFKDVAGKWNTENNLHKTFTLKTNMDQAKMGASGKDFQRDNVKNSFKFNLEETGPEGIMVMGITDMTGDGKYVVGQDDDGNDIVAEDMSFRSMWSQGFLSDKFYEKFPKGSDPKWITNKDNVDHLADLISEYGADVAEFTHGKERAKYDAKQQQKQQASNPQQQGGYFGYSFAPDVNKEGMEKRIEPVDASRAYNALENKTPAWQGAQGYYAYLPQSDRYVRYDTIKDYQLDNKNKKLATNEAAWKQIFGEDKAWSGERVISGDRVRELEGAFMVPRSGGGNMG